MGTLRWFGHPYDAPAWDDMAETPRPVGELCLHCSEPIGPDDDGVTIPYASQHSPAAIVPMHVECHLRSMVGSVAHLEGRCGCATGNFEDDQPQGSYREEAQKVMEIWKLRRL